MTTQTSDHWLARLMATFPTPGWTAERAQAFFDACRGASTHHCTQAVARMQQGGWTDRFPPTPPQFREFVNRIRDEERDRRDRELDRRKRLEEVHEVAAPWHAKLWSAVWWREMGIEPPAGLRLHNYLAIVDRHRLIPEDAGVRVRTNGPDRWMYTDHAARDPKVDQAIREAEDAYRASGLDEDPLEANRAAVAALTGIGGRV